MINLLYIMLAVVWGTASAGLTAAYSNINAVELSTHVKRVSILNTDGDHCMD